MICIECGSKLNSIQNSGTTNRKVSITGESSQFQSKQFERSDCNSTSAQVTSNTQQRQNSFTDSSLQQHFKLPEELVEGYALSLVKGNNLATCLYYNLACCYQRMGLLDEAVEYLELSSNKLDETISFYAKQEQALVLLK